MWKHYLRHLATCLVMGYFVSQWTQAFVSGENIISERKLCYWMHYHIPDRTDGGKATLIRTVQPAYSYVLLSSHQRINLLCAAWGHHFVRIFKIGSWCEADDNSAYSHQLGVGNTTCHDSQLPLSPKHGHLHTCEPLLHVPQTQEQHAVVNSCKFTVDFEWYLLLVCS